MHFVSLREGTSRADGRPGGKGSPREFTLRMLGRIGEDPSTGERMELTAQAPTRKGLDRPWVYLVAGGVVVGVAAGLAVSVALAVVARGTDWSSAGALALLFVPVAGFGFVGLDTVRHGRRLRRGSVVHRGRGVVRFGSHDWSRLGAYYLALAVALGLCIALALAGLSAVVSPILFLGVLSGLVMTANLQSDYLQDVRGVPPRPAGLLAWALAIVGCLGLFVGVANALRLSEKYDL